MQQIVNPQIPAQHLPAGWAYPNHAAQPTPSPAGPGPSGATAAKVRWGRVLPLLAGVALLAFGLWSVAQPDSTAPDKGSAVSGGGTSIDEVDVARAERARVAPLAMTPPAVAVPRRAAARPAATPATVAGGGGTAAAAQLPYTGMETWIAAFLGLMLLAVGICVHVHAVRIGMTALLYRRGILLRPLDCARVAQSRGSARLRVGLSNLLHRLLEEPGGDFVSARFGRNG